MIKATVTLWVQKMKYGQVILTKTIEKEYSFPSKPQIGERIAINSAISSEIEQITYVFKKVAFDKLVIKLKELQIDESRWEDV